MSVFFPQCIMWATAGIRDDFRCTTEHPQSVCWCFEGPPTVYDEIPELGTASLGDMRAASLGQKPGLPVAKPVISSLHHHH